MINSLSSINELLNHIETQNQIILSLKTVKQESKQELFQNRILELLIKISNTYINIPVEDFDKTIDSSLAELGEFVRADRFYIFDYDFENMTAKNTYEWCAEEIEPQIQYLQNTYVGDMPDWTETHIRGNFMYVFDVLSLPDGSSLREILEPQKIKSILTIPLMDGDTCIGFTGFDWVRNNHIFNEDEKKLLEVFAEMIVSIQKRRKNKNEQSQLINSLDELKRSQELLLAESKLQNTMNQLTNLIQYLHTGTLFENVDRKISLTNQYFCDLFGMPLSPEQLIGFDCIEAAQTTKLLMVDPEGFIDKINRIVTSKIPALNETLELKDGRFLEFDYIPIFHFEELAGHLWAYRDITEKTLEQNSISIQKNFANTLSAIFDFDEALNVIIKAFVNLDDIDCGGIYLFNPSTNLPELVKHKNLSQEFIKKVSSYEPDAEQIKLAKSGHLIHGRYEDIFPNNWTLKDRDNILSLAIIPVKHKKETIGIINLGSKKTEQINKQTILTAEMMALQVGTVLNRIKVNDALIANQKNFRNLFDTIDDFMFILDTEGNIIETNQSVIDRLGYTADELKTLHVLAVHPADRREEAGSIVKKMIEGDELYCPVPLCSKNGEIIPVETRVVLGEWDHKPVLFGISRDMTENLKVMKSLEQTIQKEKELNDLKSRFVSMASHEFRTPLASILMSAETLSSYWKKMSEEQTDAKLDNIKHQVFHLDSIVSNVMMVSKIQEGKINLSPKEIDLNIICKDIIQNFKTIENRDVEIKYQSEFSSLIMSLDERLMIQVLHNLISNAIKYSKPEPKVIIQLKADQKFVILSIKDNGIGIPTSDHIKLFQPFFRASNVKSIEGNGLGLNIAKQSMILHGGDICFESEVNKGTEFFVFLPKSLITHFENNITPNL